MKLYGYWRSSAAYRVRIALNLKGIAYEQESVHLVKDGGQQHMENYRAMNPTELVPTLVDGDFVLNQSVAILDYLDDKIPNPPLYPVDAGLRAQIKALVLDIACDIHPLNNLRVLQHLSGHLGHSEQERDDWYRHWLKVGFTALEGKLQRTAGTYCFGDTLNMADVVLVPQVYNAYRYKLPMGEFPLIDAIAQRCNALPAFQEAAPEQQPDAV
ncbi:maleylacetoacetate isomerase [Salinispirillum marinum]|uniref:Maleylacetoacetate isomerase n=2 Tax=Saccharospirillaceae TaxID=255527 RepID=A0ABV8BHK7_9GAMM